MLAQLLVVFEQIEREIIIRPRRYRRQINIPLERRNVIIVERLKRRLHRIARRFCVDQEIPKQADENRRKKKYGEHAFLLPPLSSCF